MKDLGFYNCVGGVNGDLPTELSYRDLINAISYTDIEKEIITKIFLPKELIISVNNMSGFFPFVNYPTIGFLKNEKSYEGIRAEFIVDENIKPFDRKSRNDNQIYSLYIRNDEISLEIRSTLA